MKMIYNGTPVKSLNIKHYEMNTNDCDMVASDLQAGRTAVARGKKITGTGKCFSFASYGEMSTNTPFPIPTSINVITISSMDYPIKMNIELGEMHNIDFSLEPTVGSVVVDNISYNVKVSTNNNMLNIICDKNLKLQMFYGKDEYT